MVNGMLIRRPSRADFARERGWPAEGWDYDRHLLPAFQRVEASMRLTTTPSADGLHYGGGTAQFLRAAMAANRS